jgi:hypothetical protein
MHEACRKIIESFEGLKKILEGRAVFNDETIIIPDPPFEIRILKKEELVEFLCDGEEVALLTKKGLQVKDEAIKDEVEMWIVALSNLSFRRYRFTKLRD